MYLIHPCFICRPSDSSVSEDAGIEPRTLSLTVRHSSHSARSHIMLLIIYVCRQLQAVEEDVLLWRHPRYRAGPRERLPHGRPQPGRKARVRPLRLSPHQDQGMKSVLRTHDILVWIRIRGSMPMTNGSGSSYFHL